METLGLAMQILGVMIAAVALVIESRSRSRVEPQTLTTGRRLRPQNPWRTPTDVRLRRPTSIDRRQYKEHLQGKTVRAQLGHMSDPEVVAASTFLVEHQLAREKLLAQDWDEQTAMQMAMSDRLKRLFEEQSRLVAEQQAAVDRRVRVEGFGLLLAAVGTILSGVAG